MKKILALSAIALAASASFAQSSVTVYGIADVGVTRVSGIKNGSQSLLSSGIMDGSRLGFRGNEDLGGGYRAIFTLEHRLELDTGGISNRPPSASQLPDRITQASLIGLPASPALQGAVTAVANAVGASIGVNLAGNFWDRQAFVGLITPFGAVLAGRQYTPAYEVSATFDTLGTQSALSFGQVAAIPSSIDIRVSNSLAYRIQQGGFSGMAMVAAGEGSTTTGRLFGAMAMYQSDAFSFGVGYNQRNNERKAKSLTSLVVGGSAAIGPGRAFAEYVKIKDDNPSGLAATFDSLTASIGPTFTGLIKAAYQQDAAGLQVGYKLTTGVNTFYLAYNRFDDKRAINADVSSYGLTYSYALSKRTDINASATRFVNSKTAQAAPGGTGYLGGVTTSAGVDSTSLALGIRHRF